MFLDLQISLYPNTFQPKSQSSSSFQRSLYTLHQKPFENQLLRIKIMMFSCGKVNSNQTNEVFWDQWSNQRILCLMPGCQDYFKERASTYYNISICIYVHTLDLCIHDQCITLLMIYVYHWKCQTQFNGGVMRVKRNIWSFVQYMDKLKVG